MKEWCWLTMFWRSLWSFLRTGNRTPIAGHDFVRTDDWDILARVQVSRCARCGTYSVGWHREEPNP